LKQQRPGATTVEARSHDLPIDPADRPEDGNIRDRDPPLDAAGTG
jgi:hypothetical protein